MPLLTAAKRTFGPPRVVLVIAIAATVLSLSMGLRQSLGLFLGPINRDLSVSASAFGFAMALQNIVWGISQLFIGMIGDRYGARPVLIGSAIVYAAGLLLMAAAGPIMGLNIGGGVIAGLGVAGTGFGVLLGAVSRAVPAEKRSQTVGLVSAAGSIGTLVLAPLGQMLIADYGWRWALVAFAGVAAMMALISVAIGDEGTGAKTAGASPGFHHEPLSTATPSSAIITALYQAVTIDRLVRTRMQSVGSAPVWHGYATGARSGREPILEDLNS
jgi:MFS family permease